MDEATIKVKGMWNYLYRAVDKCGATIDFMLSKKCDNKGQEVFLENTWLFWAATKICL
jgi:putative transposase